MSLLLSRLGTVTTILGAGSFTLTGRALSAPVARSISLSAGSFVLTGRALSAPVVRSIAFSPGVYSLTGKSLGVPVVRTAVLDGTFELTGFPISTGREPVDEPRRKGAPGGRHKDREPKAHRPGVVVQQILREAIEPVPQVLGSRATRRAHTEVDIEVDTGSIKFEPMPLPEMLSSPEPAPDNRVAILRQQREEEEFLALILEFV